MSNFEQSYTEKGKGNKSRENRRGLSQIENNIISMELNARAAEERRTNKEKQFGRNNERIAAIREQGINDRVNAIPYDSEKYENELDKNNYHEGFFVMGNRAIHGRLEVLSDEQLQKIALNDYISGVNFKDLPDAIKNNISYAQGSIMASIMSESKGKGRR